jgi:radical SAM superfamily enzyme YgiQ (UPF0313 family)
MKLHGLLINASGTPAFNRSPGCYRIAHILRQNNWDIEVLDFFNYCDDERLYEFFKTRITKDTKFIGISFLFSAWNQRLHNVCTMIKTSFPHIHIISGGNVNLKGHTFNEFGDISKLVDYHFQGWSEIAILVLLKYLYSNGPKPKYLIGHKTKTIPANTFYPAFPMKDLSIIYEDRDFILEDEWLGIEFSRGCKFACSFCDFPIIGVKEDHTVDVEHFLYQVRDAYDRFGVKNYTVADETFNDATEKITKYADGVEQLNFTPTFSGFIRADLLISRPKDREELLRMNFLGQYYGVETFNHQSGKAVGKGMHPDKMKQGLLDIKNYFLNSNRKLYRGTLSLILGLPYETEDTLSSTFDWVYENWRDQSVLYWVLGIPNGEFDVKSKLSSEYSKYNYRTITPEDEAKYDPALIQEFIEVTKNRVVSGTAPSELMMWKNDNMTIFDAYKIQTKFDSIFFEFTLDNYTLSNLNIDGPAENRFNKYQQDQNAEAGIKKISDYLDKKINYSRTF